MLKLIGKALEYVGNGTNKTDRFGVESRSGPRILGLELISFSY